MHMGQGSRPTTCCRYMPKASIATQATLISASTRRGASSIQFNTIILIPHPIAIANGAASETGAAHASTPVDLAPPVHRGRPLRGKTRSGSGGVRFQQRDPRTLGRGGGGPPAFRPL